MGIFNERENEKQYKEIIRAIKSSNIGREYSAILTKYVNEIYENKRPNPYIDFDLLQTAVLHFCVNVPYSSYELRNDLDSASASIRFLLPQGKDTPNFEKIKSEIIVNFVNFLDTNMFNATFYSLFETRNDYLQVMGIIQNDDLLIDNFDKIVNFAVTLSKEVDDLGQLKREILYYLHNFLKIMEGEEDYLEERVNEARRRYGVYPGIDEKTLAQISREVEKARGIVKSLDNMERKAEHFERSIDAKTKTGTETITTAVTTGKKQIEEYATSVVKKMQEDLASAKKELLDELNKYIESLQSSLKTSSDQVFSQLLNDAREKLEQIRELAKGLSTTTTSELLRIQRQTEDSLKTLKRYVESNPELTASLRVASENEEVMKALLDFSNRQRAFEQAQQRARENGEELVVPQGGLIVPSKEIVVATDVENVDEFMVPKFEMTEGILPIFDRKIPYKDRMKMVDEAIARLEAEGYIIPPALREALPWYILGKKIVYFYGPTQSGKTTVAELLTKVAGTHLIDGGKITEDHSITSFNDVRGRFDENALFYALYNGMTCFYDEMDNGNPDNLIVLGTFASKLVNKIDNPDKEVFAQFAKRRFVPINTNARIISAGNTTGKGRNREYTARSKMDESSLERLVPIYVGYNEEVESKIFSRNQKWYNFFKFFREQCNAWAEQASLDSAEGNLTTGDASTIVECIKQDSMTVSQLINGLFVQTKEDDYLAHLMRTIKNKYQIEESPNEIDESEIKRLNNKPLGSLNEREIAKVFIYEANKSKYRGKALNKRR